MCHYHKGALTVFKYYIRRIISRQTHTDSLVPLDYTPHPIHLLSNLIQHRYYPLSGMRPSILQKSYSFFVCLSFPLYIFLLSYFSSFGHVVLYPYHNTGWITEASTLVVYFHFIFNVICDIVFLVQ